MAVHRAVQPTYIEFTCLSCGRKNSALNVGRATCLCGSRCFTWDDHWDDGRQQRAAAMRRQGRTVAPIKETV